MGKLYKFLEDIKNGNNPGWDVSGIDDLLDDVDFNSRNPSKSVVTITFDKDEEYYDIFGLDSDDQYWVNKVRNPHYDYYDVRDGDEDNSWRDYIYGSLDDDNKNKVTKIGTLISKNYFKLRDHEKLNLIYNEFRDSIDEIVHTFRRIEEDCKNEIFKKEIFDELGNNFYSFGIREVYPFYKYKTTVNILYRLLQTIGNTDMTIQELLKEIIEKFVKGDYGWYEDLYYNTNCVEFDNEQFNSDSSWYLDKIIEKLEDSEDYVDVEQYYDIVDIINQKYGFDKPIKTNTNKIFVIDRVNPENNKIIIQIRSLDDTTGDAQTRQLDSIDDIERLINQYELFNERRKIIKKFLRMI